MAYASQVPYGSAAYAAPVDYGNVLAGAPAYGYETMAAPAYGYASQPAYAQAPVVETMAAPVQYSYAPQVSQPVYAAQAPVYESVAAAPAYGYGQPTYGTVSYGAAPAYETVAAPAYGYSQPAYAAPAPMYESMAVAPQSYQPAYAAPAPVYETVAAPQSYMAPMPQSASFAVAPNYGYTAQSATMEQMLAPQAYAQQPAFNFSAALPPMTVTPSYTPAPVMQQGYAPQGSMYAPGTLPANQSMIMYPEQMMGQMDQMNYGAQGQQPPGPEQGQRPPAVTPAVRPVPRGKKNVKKKKGFCCC